MKAMARDYITLLYKESDLLLITNAFPLVFNKDSSNRGCVLIVYASCPVRFPARCLCASHFVSVPGGARFDPRDFFSFNKLRAQLIIWEVRICLVGNKVHGREHHRRE